MLVSICAGSNSRQRFACTGLHFGVGFGVTLAAPSVRSALPTSALSTAGRVRCVATAAVAFTIALAIETTPAERIIFVLAVAIAIGAWLWTRRRMDTTPQAAAPSTLDV
jgi:hypothetical protein